jgi:hypothetical protein
VRDLPPDVGQTLKTTVLTRRFREGKKGKVEEPGLGSEGKKKKKKLVIFASKSPVVPFISQADRNTCSKMRCRSLRRAYYHQLDLIGATVGVVAGVAPDVISLYLAARAKHPSSCLGILRKAKCEMGGVMTKRGRGAEKERMTAWHF